MAMAGGDEKTAYTMALAKAAGRLMNQALLFREQRQGAPSPELEDAVNEARNWALVQFAAAALAKADEAPHRACTLEKRGSEGSLLGNRMFQVVRSSSAWIVDPGTPFKNEGINLLRSEFTRMLFRTRTLRFYRRAIPLLKLPRGQSSGHSRCSNSVGPTTLVSNPNAQPARPSAPGLSWKHTKATPSPSVQSCKGGQKCRIP